MAFDRTNPADLLALKNEVNTDPLGMGYLSSGNTQKLLDLLNDGDKNLGGETTAGDITPAILVNDLIAPGDLEPLGQFGTGELEWVKMVMEISQTPNDNISFLRTKLESVFPANTTTGAAIRASGSRKVFQTGMVN
jgi:hypothetical protein